MVKVPKKQMDDELTPVPETPSDKLFPRDKPLRFAYMFVAVNNPYKDLYRQMLKAESPHHFYEDVPKPHTWKKPQFDAMIQELRPNDTVVLVRLDQLSGDPAFVLDQLQKLTEERVNIRLICKAAKATTATSALAQDIRVQFEKVLKGSLRVMEGSDGGGGNGGP